MDASKGEVWLAIVEQVDDPGSESDYISVTDMERARFAKHPWSIGGGGAAELKDRLDQGRSQTIQDRLEYIGTSGQTNADEVMTVNSPANLARYGVEPELVSPLVIGSLVRDWAAPPSEAAFLPYRHGLLVDISDYLNWYVRMWPYRELLWERATFSHGTYRSEGRPWFEWHLIRLSRLGKPGMVFSNLATHNHFAYDRVGVLLNPHAPALRLIEGTTADDYLRLTGLLNAAVALFWMKQVCRDKGAGGLSGGLATESWEHRYEYDGAKISQFPLPAALPPADLAGTLDSLSRDRAACLPSAVCAITTPSRHEFDVARLEGERILADMVSAQEELDWTCLHLYGLTEEPLVVPNGATAPPVQLGERAFEIMLARKEAADQLRTSWFTRHRSVPTTELPAHWPSWYQGLVRKRIDLIERDRDVALVERPEHKRRWAREPWEKLEEAALQAWLADRLEDRRLWFEGVGDTERAVCRSVAQLADRIAAIDPDFFDVARLWKGAVEIDPVSVIAELVADEHVPAQTAARYKGKGLDKRAVWERTWDLQRMEDRGEPLPDGLARIPVPPKYAPVDFAKPSYWKQRGKLDVPKERFTSIAGAEREADPTLVLAWAGFDHAQLAQAIATLAFERQPTDGWNPDRLWPIVVSLIELLPWLAQWHGEVDPRLGDSPANQYRAMAEQLALAGGRTNADAAKWLPTAPTRGRRKKDQP